MGLLDVVLLKVRPYDGSNSDDVQCAVATISRRAFRTICTCMDYT